MLSCTGSKRLFCALFLTLNAVIMNLGVEILSEKTVQISELNVLRFPKVGDDVALMCKFKLGGKKHRLYKVNWWRGKDQFYTYERDNQRQKHAYTFDGINVMVNESSDEKVMLANVNENTSGEFKCEVMGEGPAFRTAVQTAPMTVIVPPRMIQITRTKSVDYEFRINDMVALNCTAFGVKPRPKIMWRINDQQVKPSEQQRFADQEDYDGRITATASLRFTSPKYFANRIAEVSCIVLVENHEFAKKEFLKIDPSAAFHLYSSANMGIFSIWQISTILCTGRFLF